MSGQLRTARQLSEEAAALVYQCVLEMGERQQNPVLLLLDTPTAIQQNVKYPKENIQFGKLGIRAYYHCHSEPYLREHEHGHFHIFINNNKQDPLSEWCHLVALSIDAQGQPMRWFTVNHWVTAGGWLNAAELKTLFYSVLNASEPGIDLLHKWLYGMLCLFNVEICQLQETRDALLLKKGTEPMSLEARLADRELYDLSETPIGLIDKLSEYLT